ncbi:MAG: hypothetical protein HOI01_00040 [Proteobacteria bacterium]|jgi:hypothetical protein|nr:hypothetical protein [Pseudomonadota bacterium]
MTTDNKVKYYEEDNKVLHEFIEFFYQYNYIPLLTKIFTIGGKKWEADHRTTYLDKGGKVPTNRRLESKVVFRQMDNASPAVLITIQTRKNFSEQEHPEI